MKYPAVSYLVIIACVFALAFGQLLFKILSAEIGSLSDILTNRKPFFIFGTALGLYSLSTIAWILVLRDIPLSHAYLFMSFGFILVPAMSYFVLGGSITSRHIMGTILIISGVWLSAG